MKRLKRITAGLLLLISISITAQQGINYKAIVKDASGNLIANDLIIVQFTILETSSTGTIVYKELILFRHIFAHAPLFNSLSKDTQRF